MNCPPQHWSAVRTRPTPANTPATPSTALARVRAEGMRRGLYNAASPVTPPPPQAPASLSSVPATPQEGEARWNSDEAIRAEFRSKNRWLAFVRAAAAGRVRISKQATVTGGR